MNQSFRTLTADGVFGSNFHIFVNRAVETFSLPLHSHDFIEFAYISEGRGFHHIEDHVEPVAKGQMFIIPRGVSHVFRPTSASSSNHPLIVYNCVFTPSAITQLSAIVNDAEVQGYLNHMLSDSFTHSCVFDKHGLIELMMVRLHREYKMPRAGSLTYLHTLLLQLMIETYRLQHDPIDTFQNEENNSHFIHVLRFVEDHYGDDITLSSLAEMSQWSERHLQRLFKQHTGQTFRSYLQNLRIRKSCEALRTTHHKISMIADEVGYKDMDSFIDVFKRIVGQSPSEYRQRVKQE